jgi:hypothetical protein
MPLDIVSGTEVQTQATGVKIDPSAFRRQAIAQGQLVSGAGQDVASLFSQVSNKLQDIQNTKHLAEADNAVIDFNEKQQEEVLKHPNPSEWSGIYKANFKQFQDGLMSNPSYGPEVRNQISNMLERSKTATDINIRTAANKRNVTDLGNAIELGMNKAVNSLGQKDASEKYYAGLLEMKNSGVIDESQYNQRLLEAPKVIEQGQFKQAIIIDPIHTFQRLQDKNYLPSLSGEDRDKAITEARAKAGEKQVSNGDKIQNEIRNTPAYLVDRKKIQQSANSGEISQRRADGIINSFSAQDKRVETNMADILKAQVTTHDFKNDLWPSLFITNLKEKASGLSPRLQAEFNTFIDSHAKAAAAPQVSENNRISNDLRKRMFSKYEEFEKLNGINIPEVIDVKKDVVEGSRSITNFWQGVMKETPLLVASKDTLDQFMALKDKPEEFEEKYGKGTKWEDAALFINNKQAADIKAIDEFFSPDNPKRLDPVENTAFFNRLAAPRAMQKTINALKGMTTPPETAKTTDYKFVAGKTYTDKKSGVSAVWDGTKFITLPAAKANP